MNSKIEELIPNIQDHHRQLQQLIDNILDQKVAKTDMKLRHIVTKGIEVILKFYVLSLLRIKSCPLCSSLLTVFTFVPH